MNPQHTAPEAVALSTELRVHIQLSILAYHMVVVKYSAYKNNLAGMPGFTMTLCCVKIIFYGIEIAREGK